MSTPQQDMSMFTLPQWMPTTSFNQEKSSLGLVQQEFPMAANAQHENQIVPFCEEVQSNPGNMGWVEFMILFLSFILTHTIAS